jgi:hypothetical protein
VLSLGGAEFGRPVAVLKNEKAPASEGGCYNFLLTR